MNDVVNGHWNKPKDIITAPKREIFIVLPSLGTQSKTVAQQRYIYKFYGCFNPQIIFRNIMIRRIKSFFLAIKTDSAAPLGLTAGIVMIARGKQNVLYMTEKQNISKRWRVTAILLPSLIWFK